MKRIGVFTSGGDSPGMNAAVRAVVRTAAANGVDVFGIYRGYEGMIAGDIRPLGPRDVGGIISRGGTILGSARSAAFREPAGRAEAAKQLKKFSIDGIVAIGGDGTYRGAAALEEEHGIACIGLPGTIDNDIGGTDFTIGFDTAINTAMDAIDKLRDTSESHGRLFYVEVMGRHNGYIAMMSGIASGAEDILVPETPTDLNALIEHLRADKAKGKQSAIVVVSEGDEIGDAITVAKTIADKSEFKEYRVAVIGHLQRGGSPTAFDRILASRLGVRAVHALIDGESNQMAGIHANEIVLRPFSDCWDTKAAFDLSLMDTARQLAT